MADFTPDMQKPTGRFAIVAAEFNGFVVEKLVAGAIAALVSHGVERNDVDVVSVPGALEIPLVCQQLARSGRYAAIVAAGCVIRGATDHYDVVVNQSAAGIAAVALDAGVPVLNAVLTVETLDQAIDRAGGKAGNKGHDAACAAIALVNLLSRLPR